MGVLIKNAKGTRRCVRGAGRGFAAVLFKALGLLGVTLALSLGLVALPACAQEQLLMMPMVEVQSVVDGRPYAAVSNGTSTGGDGMGQALQQLRVALVSDAANLQGDITYEVYENGAWSGETHAGAFAGAASVPIQAVRMRLDGEAATFFDLYYRVAVVGEGWLGWTTADKSAGTPGAGSLEAVQATLVAKGDVPPGKSDDPAAAIPTIQVSGYGSGPGWQSATAPGETVGTIGQALHSFKASLSAEGEPESEPVGALRYRVFAGAGWRTWAHDGEEACPVNASAPIQALQMNLGDEEAALYDIYYRVYDERYGWMGLAKNGQSAGSAEVESAVCAVQVWLVAKGAPAPTPAPAATTPEAFIERFRSGDAELDAIVDTIIDQVTGRGEDALRKAFDYVASYPYVYMDIYPQGDWSPGFAKEMYQNHGGNCYRYAALFREIARGLGYKARVVSGAVPTYDDPKAAHGWCEIEIDGVPYIFDPDMAHGYSGHNFYQRSYDNPPLAYTIYERGPW